MDRTSSYGRPKCLLPNSATSYILTRLVKVIEEQAMTNFPGKTTWYNNAGRHKRLLACLIMCCLSNFLLF